MVHYSWIEFCFAVAFMGQVCHDECAIASDEREKVSCYFGIYVLVRECFALNEFIESLER